MEAEIRQINDAYSHLIGRAFREGRDNDIGPLFDRYRLCLRRIELKYARNRKPQA